jgi:hypothetical protein
VVAGNLGAALVFFWFPRERQSPDWRVLATPIGRLAFPGTQLKHQLHGELQFTRVLRALNHIEVGGPEDAARKIQVGMIQRVENIEPELHS